MNTGIRLSSSCLPWQRVGLCIVQANPQLWDQSHPTTPQAECDVQLLFSVSLKESVVIDVFQLRYLYLFTLALESNCLASALVAGFLTEVQALSSISSSQNSKSSKRVNSTSFVVISKVNTVLISYRNFKTHHSGHVSLVRVL